MPPPRVDSEAVDLEAEKERNEINAPAGRPSSSHSSDTAADRYEGIRAQHKEGGDPDRRGSSGSRRGSFRMRQPSVSAQLRNPLAGKTETDVLRDVDQFVDEKGLNEFRDEFQKGALLARVINRQGGYEHVPQISEAERDVLRYEQTHRWKQPFMLYFLVVLCAGSAIVQGMDQTAVNGAQVSQSIPPLVTKLTIARSSTSRSLASQMNGNKAFSMVHRKFNVLSLTYPPLLFGSFNYQVVPLISVGGKECARSLPRIPPREYFN